MRQSPIESLQVPVERGVGLISGGIRNLTESNLIDFVLRIHPQEKGIQRLHRECIRTSGDITIEHLKRFLGGKLAYEHYHHFHIITPLVSGKQVVLDDQMTLREIRNQISDRRRGEVLMLQYRRHIEYPLIYFHLKNLKIMFTTYRYTYYELENLMGYSCI